MGKITVNIQREDRLEAIVELSKAIHKVAEALIAPVRVNVENCNVTAPNGTGIYIGIGEEVDREIIQEVDDEMIKEVD